MTYEETKALTDHREQRQHELTMSILAVFQKDPDMKYFMGLLGGVGVASLTEFIQGAGAPQSTEPKQNNDWAWLLPLAGVGAGPIGIVTGEYIREQLSGSSGGPWGSISGVVAMSSAGFAGFCASYLLLKAICGNEGIGKVLGSLGALGAIA